MSLKIGIIIIIILLWKNISISLYISILQECREFTLPLSACHVVNVVKELLGDVIICY